MFLEYTNDIYWQLDPSKFVINNPELDKGTQELVFKIGEALGF